MSDLYDGQSPGQVLSCLLLMSRLDNRSFFNPEAGEGGADGDVLSEEFLGSLAEEVIGDAMLEQVCARKKKSFITNQWVSGFQGV